MSSERRICELCGKKCYGLMDFAYHVAHKHGISAIEYWDTYGDKNISEKGKNKNLNPSRRDSKWKEN